MRNPGNRLPGDEVKLLRMIQKDLKIISEVIVV
jgi:hypothetical protein